MGLSIKGEAGKAMNGTDRSFETLRIGQWELAFGAHGEDSFTWTAATDNVAGTGTVVPEEGQEIELYKDTVRKFKGTVTKVIPGAKSVTVLVNGPAWWMGKIQLTGDFTDDNGGTDERSNFVFPTQGLATSIRALIDRFIAVGIPVTRGTVSTAYSCMKMSFPNTSCAAALADILLWVPDAVAYCEYAAATPVLHVERRDDLAALTYTVGTDNIEGGDKLAIRPRTDLQVKRVELNYADRHPTTGKVRYQKQASGTAALGKVQPITISGPETVAFLPKSDYENYAIKTAAAAVTADFVRANDSTISGVLKQYGSAPGDVWNVVTTYVGTSPNYTASRKTFPGVSYRRDNGALVKNLAGKYLVISADLPEWAMKQYGGIRVTISGTWLASHQSSLGSWSKAFGALRAGAATGGGFFSSNGTNYYSWLARPFTCSGVLINTSFPTSTTVYKAWDYDFINPPAGLAADLKAAQDWVPDEGPFSVVADEWPLANLVKRKINIANGRAAWATMNALVKQVRYDQSGRADGFRGADQPHPPGAERQHRLPMSDYDFELVWLTSGGRGTPHAAVCAAANPALMTHVRTGPETGEDGWRNCDRNIRAAAAGTELLETTRRVLFLEWDVLVTCDLRTVFPRSRAVDGIEGAMLRSAVRDGRAFGPFEEIDRLPAAIQPHAVGIAPLAVVMISRPALAAICAPEWDAVFAADIFSELRLPTVIRHLGHACKGSARLPHVTCGPVVAKTPGVWHAVKPGGAR